VPHGFRRPRRRGRRILADRCGAAGNPNLEFVLDDAARTTAALRAEGKTVLLHCVEGRSRTPSVAARYSVLLGEEPRDVLQAMRWADPNPELWRAAVGGNSR
jgi:ADP-ribosyl-[dinitrogen reductase] hydrolase